MSFSFVSGFVYRNTNLPASTNSFTWFVYAKRSGVLSGVRHLGVIRPYPESDGHDWLSNNPGQTPMQVIVQANWATAEAKGNVLPDGVWTPIAMVGSGGNLTLHMWDSGISAWASWTVGQGVFTPGRFRVGDAGDGANLFGGLIAHIRLWNAPLTTTELTAEKNSASAVRTSGLLSAHDGASMTLATALAGQSGGAFTASGTVTMSSDNPSLAPPVEAVELTGTVTLPGTVQVVSGQRYNRLLYSGDLSATVWTLQGHTLGTPAAAAPTNYGTARRVIFQNNQGGVYQKIFGVPEGRHVFAMGVRKVNARYVAVRQMADGFGAGSQAFFDLDTNTWASANDFGALPSGQAGQMGFRVLSSGWVLIWLSNVVFGTTRIVEFYPADTAGVQVPAAGRSIDVAAFQHEEGLAATFHKPTAGSMVTRSLASIATALASSTVGVGQQVQASAILADNTGAPWDQAGPITFSSSDTTKATISAQPQYSDIAGRASLPVTGVAAGPTNITSSIAGITSPNAPLTVGTATAFFLDVRVERGWGGSSGWYAGVYRKHPTERYPTTKLFEAPNQVFQQSEILGQSQLKIPIPASVSVSDGELLELVLENDNYNGKPVDAPGMQPFPVVAA